MITECISYKFWKVFFANNLIWFDLLLSFSKYLFQMLRIYKITRTLYQIGGVFRPFPWYEESFLIEKIANHHQSMRIKRSRMHIEYRFWIIQFKAYSKKILFLSYVVVVLVFVLIVHIHFLVNAPIIIKLSHCVC